MTNTCSFRIQLLELRNLKSHKGSPPCAQVQVACFNQVFSTKAIAAGFNSKLAETFIFPDLPLAEDFLSTAQCSFVLYHLRDRARTRLGEYSLPLASVFEAEKHRLKGSWCAFVGNLDNVAGFLRISAALQPTPSVTSEAEERLPEDDEGDVLGIPENLVQLYQLTVHVYKAESLPQFGVRNSISALVSATVGAKSVRTRVVQDNTWPEWRERLLLPTQQPTVLRSILIQLLAIGRNRSDEEIDSLQLDLAQVYHARIPPSWFHLYTGRYKEMYAGRLLLSFYMEPSNDPLAAVESGGACEEPELSHYYLWLCVPEVAGLDFSGKLKVRFECGVFSLDSQYEESSNRRWLWRDKSSFPQTTLELPTDSSQVPKMLIKVVTNSIEEREISVAMLELDVKTILANGSYQVPPVWRRLTSLIDPRVPETKKALTGWIQVSANLMKIIRHSRKEFSEEKNVASEVWVNVHQVREVPKIYKGPLRRVFLQVSVCGVTKLTTEIEETDNPNWNQLLKWRLHLPKDPDGFTLDLWEARPWPEDNFLLGSAYLPPSDFEPALISQPRLPTARFYPLQKGSECTGQVLAGAALYSLASKEEKVPPAPSQQSDMRKYIIQVLIVGTRKLKSAGPKASFRPVVKVSIGGEALQETEVAERKFNTSDNNHNILQTLEFPWWLAKGPERAPSLVFRVYENRAYTRELLGTAEVSIGSYLPWLPRPIVHPESPGDRSQQDDEEERQEDKPLSEDEIIEETDPYDGFFVDVRDLRKLNYQVDTSQIEVTDTMEALTADRELVPREPQQWPGYIPESFARPYLAGSLEQSMPLAPFFETFPLFQYPRTSSGLLKSLVRIIDPRGGTPVSLEPLKREVVKSANLSARLYCLSLENVHDFPESAKVIIWCKTWEGDEKFRVQVEAVRLSNGSLELMTMVKVPITLPDHAYLWVCIMVQDGDARWVLGSTEIDLERRWFCRDYQEIRSPELRKVPVERRRLETGDPLVSSGELVMWVDILSVEEATQHQPEKLISSIPVPYVLRVIVWSVYDLVLSSPQNLQVSVSVKDGESLISQQTDIHFEAETSAEFNWRCVFNIGLPAEVSFFNVNLSHIPGKGLRDPLGDLTVDLSSFYLEVQKKEVVGHLPKAKFPLSDVSRELVGHIDLEVSLLSIDEAEENPVGLGRSEPNKDPLLPFPQSGRNHAEIEEEIREGQKKGKKTVLRLKAVLAIAVCLIILIALPLTLLSLGLL